MEIYICRHGQTLDNKNKIIQGQHPGFLSEEGFLQARLLGKSLSKLSFTHFFSSDLNRCVQTTKQANQFIRFPLVQYSKVLREKSFGVFEGKPKGTDKIYAKERNIEFRTFRAEGGESLLDVNFRASTFLTFLIEKLYFKNKTYSDEKVYFETLGFGSDGGDEVAEAIEENSTSSSSEDEEKCFENVRASLKSLEPSLNFEVKEEVEEESVRVLIITHSNFILEFLNTIFLRQGNNIITSHDTGNTSYYSLKITCQLCQDSTFCKCTEKNQKNLSYEFFNYNVSSHLKGNEVQINSSNTSTSIKEKGTTTAFNANLEISEKSIDTEYLK